MKNLPRILMIIAALGVLSLFIFPLWRISLYAPQYPDGVSMYIYINKIGGNSPGTLQNVNILNHYVGMKMIEPDSIPELVYFPYIVGALSVLALAAAALNRSKWFLIWAIIFFVLTAIGLYDFYLWEYDYGSNLSPTAPIKIPGASFQPPLIGRKIILNFVADSFPHIGGILAGLSGVLAIAAWRIKRKSENHA